MIEYLLYLGLIILALFSIFSVDLKTAIIKISAFALLISFVYLYFHAPDVSLAEAVISGSLGTILYVFTIRNCKDIETRMSKNELKNSLFYGVVIVFACVFMIFLTGQVNVIDTKELVVRMIDDLQQFGDRVYIVSGILLDYRLFDTVFEALILLVAGMDVAHMIKFKKSKVQYF